MRWVKSSCAILLASSLLFGASRLPAQHAVPEIFAPGIISGLANDLSPAFTPDGQTVFFTRANPDQSTIMVSHLSAGTWSKPEIASFSGVWRDLEPAMAVDGSYLIFASNRPATDGGTAIDAFYNGAPQPGRGGNLWRVDRTASGWGSPHRLPDVVNANTSIFSPALAGDGSLYFMQPTGAKTRFHIFRAQLTGVAYQTPVAVPVSASDTAGDFDPVVAPDESFMVFSSARMPANGTSLFIAFRQNGTWSTPEYMGVVASPPSTGNIEARLSPDHRTLYFSSNRVLPLPPNPDRAASEKGLAAMEAWDNGPANIWSVSLDEWVKRGAAQ